MRRSRCCSSIQHWKRQHCCRNAPSSSDMELSSFFRNDPCYGCLVHAGKVAFGAAEGLHSLQCLHTLLYADLVSCMAEPKQGESLPNAAELFCSTGASEMLQGEDGRATLSRVLQA